MQLPPSAGARAIMPDAFRDTCIDTIAGAVAGGVSVVVSQPVDMVLTRFQHATCGTSPSSLARGLWAEGGLRTFWRGAGPLVWCVPMQNAMLFAGYGAGERWGGAGGRAPGGGGGVPPTAPLVVVGGCVGGLLQSFVVSPVEMIKIHMQFSGVHSVGLSGAVMKQISKEPVDVSGELNGAQETLAALALVCAVGVMLLEMRRICMPKFVEEKEKFGTWTVV